MASLKPLLKDVRQCTLCAEHLPEGPRPVLQLHQNAKILIAGQAPGRRVHESGIPFDDPSGQRLRDWLGVTPEVFYDEKQIAILPMGFCYPGTGKSGDLPPRPECAEKWREPLLAHMKQCQLTVVIGQYALKYHLPNQKGSVTEVVKNWKVHWPEVAPLPHPSPRNNRWLKNNPWFEKNFVPKLQAEVERVLAT